MAERAVGHAHVGDVGHMRPVRRLRLEPAFHEVGPAARALRRFGGDGRPAAAHAADSRFPRDVHHLVAADLGRIPAPRRRPGMRLAVPVHGHAEIRVDQKDVAGRCLVPFAMVPSSPIKLGEMQNKNQFIPQYTVSLNDVGMSDIAITQS